MRLHKCIEYYLKLPNKLTTRYMSSASVLACFMYWCAFTFSLSLPLLSSKILEFILLSFVFYLPILIVWCLKGSFHYLFKTEKKHTRTCSMPFPLIYHRRYFGKGLKYNGDTKCTMFTFFYSSSTECLLLINQCPAYCFFLQCTHHLRHLTKMPKSNKEAVTGQVSRVKNCHFPIY